MAITLIHPSRSRAQKALSTYQNWINKAADKNIQYILSLDNDDPQLAKYYDLFDFNNHGAIAGIIKNSNSNLVQAVNKAIPYIKGDLVVVVSDDFDCPESWDRKLLFSIPREAGYTEDNGDGTFTAHFEKYKELAAIYVNDGITWGRKCMTLPILSKSLIDKLGYIYLPKYTGMYADNDLYEICEKLGVLIQKDVLFQHNHYTNGKANLDNTYKRHNNPVSWKIGETVIKNRRLANFNIENLGKPKNILSIQIPTVIERKEQFEILYNNILKQAEGKPVEVIFECDNKEISVGAKRQKLLSRSWADYFVQIDDDDKVSDDYVDKVLVALQKKPDCVGYLESILWDGKQMTAMHSKRWAQWGSNINGYDFVRTPFFKDVIKVDLAQQVGINDMRFGEDHDFARRIKPFLKTEVFINEHLYFYTYKSMTPDESNKKYGIK